MGVLDRPDLDYFTAKRQKDSALNNEVCQATREPDGKAGYGVKPATLIKRLLINLQSGLGHSSIQDINTVQSAILTLGMLLSQASSLEEIEHYGLLCQEQLNLFVKIPNLTSIKLRKTHSSARGLYENLETASVELDLNGEEINLAKLACLPNLTFLDVSQLRSPEARGLAKAVRSLSHLQHLRVSERSDEIDHSRQLSPTPLALFFRALYSTSSPSSPNTAASDTSSAWSDSEDVDYKDALQGTEPGFPAWLQSLELMENTE